MDATGISGKGTSETIDNSQLNQPITYFESDRAASNYIINHEDNAWNIGREFFFDNCNMLNTHIQIDYLNIIAEIFWFNFIQIFW